MGFVHVDCPFLEALQRTGYFDSMQKNGVCWQDVLIDSQTGRLVDGARQIMLLRARGISCSRATARNNHERLPSAFPE